MESTLGYLRLRRLASLESLTLQLGNDEPYDSKVPRMRLQEVTDAVHAARAHGAYCIISLTCCGPSVLHSKVVNKTQQIDRMPCLQDLVCLTNLSRMVVESFREHCHLLRLLRTIPELTTLRSLRLEANGPMPLAAQLSALKYCHVACQQSWQTVVSHLHVPDKKTAMRARCQFRMAASHCS